MTTALTLDLSQTSDLHHQTLDECLATVQPQPSIQAWPALEVLVLELAVLWVDDLHIGVGVFLGPHSFQRGWSVREAARKLRIDFIMINGIVFIVDL